VKYGTIWLERYQKKYECHTLTLAGFGGNDTISAQHFLETVKDDIISYSKNKKLRNPILVGHSMGGFIALWVAASAPGYFRKVISVDGIPCISALRMPNAHPDSIKVMAFGVKTRMRMPKTPELFAISQKQILASMVSDSEQIEKLIQIASKADTRTQSDVMYEMLTLDLRKTVSAIGCPVLLFGSWIAGKNYGATHDGLLKSYQGQMAHIKNVSIEISDKAMHFIFLDDPQWFYEKIDGFLLK